MHGYRYLSVGNTKENIGSTVVEPLKFAITRETCTPVCEFKGKRHSNKKSDGMICDLLINEIFYLPILIFCPQKVQCHLLK